MRGILMTGAALTLAWANAAHAQQAGVDAPAPETIVVTATRTAQYADNVPATVSVITAQDIENQLANDIKDIARYEPGVSVRQSPSRFGATTASTGRDGNSGFNIRGLEDNRVLMLIDGIRIPDAYAFGPAAFGRGDYVDLDLLRSVEILRGPASALYGSDGLAGAVSFITKDPSHFLRDSETLAARGRVTYASADDSWAENAIVAGRQGNWSAYLSYTRRDGHELENQGDNDALNSTRTAPNPQATESNAVLARVVYAPSVSQRFRLTYDWGNRDVFTEALSGRAAPPLSASSVIDLYGTDKSDRQRITFDHSFDLDNSFITRGQWAIYYQDSHASEFSFEDRNTSADRFRNTTFDNRVWGGDVQLESTFSTAALTHRLVYGFDFSTTHQEGIRDGAPSPVPGTGEILPVRSFPNTDYTLAGAFIEDQITALDGRLLIYPSVRYDSYELTPHADALYPTITAGQSDDHITPRLGAVIWPLHWLGAFADYTTGFKAPAPSEVNNYFENLAFGYTSIPNPNLKPETSTSFEGGVRWRDVSFVGARWNGQISGFNGDYRDFIIQDVVSGSGAPGDPLVFQYFNLNRVEISGVEASSRASWDNGWGLRLGLSTATGRDTTSGAHIPLNSIDPWKLVAGLTYDDPGGRFGGQLIATHSAGKDRHDIDENCSVAAPPPAPPGTTVASPCFAPPDFTTLDLTAYWNITDAASLRVGLFNITDQKYWWWSDVRGTATAGGVVDAFTQPGRNFSVSIGYRF